MLKAHRIYLLNGTIQLCLDSRFSKYEVPVFCINEPISYTAHREDKNLKIEYADETI